MSLKPQPIPNSRPETAARERLPASNHWVWIGVLFFVYLLLLAVSMISAGFKWATGGEQAASALFGFASNPFMALLMGAMATALVQSSSTVSSVIVALVAAGMPVGIAVPMIMGANIGTTVTNTLVSLGHMQATAEFRRAFAAATIHDFFNILSVVIFLPLEMTFGFLERVSGVLVGLFVFEGSASVRGLNFVGGTTKPVVDWIGAEGLLGQLLPGKLGGVVLVLLGIGLIFLSINRIGKLLKSAMTGRAKKLLHAALGRGAIVGITVGTVITILVQSSSTTTSLVVPLAGNGLLTLAQVYPFTLGANIGTCITALLAATAVTGTMAGPALQIALVHLLYNIAGTIVIFGTPLLRRLPILCAEWLAEAASVRKVVAVAYMVVTFFLIPSAFIGISYLMSGGRPAVAGGVEEAAEEFGTQAPDYAIH